MVMVIDDDDDNDDDDDDDDDNNSDADINNHVEDIEPYTASIASVSIDFAKC